jgi:hypothetical protein
MPASTFLSDALVRPGSVETGGLFSALQKQYLVRPPLTAEKARFTRSTNEITQASPQDQRVAQEDLLVRLPSLRESKWKVIVLQRWIGLVEQVMADRFVAVVNDATNSQNPAEQVEVDLEEFPPAISRCSPRALHSIGASVTGTLQEVSESGSQRSDLPDSLTLARPSWTGRLL